MARFARTARTPLAEYSARRIAILKPSALGDIVHALPVLSALRSRYPLSHITWVVNRSFEPLLIGNPDLDATLSIDRGGFRGGLWHMADMVSSLASKLRHGRFDLVVDLQGLLRTGLMAGFTGAMRKVGLSTAREGSHLFYTDTIASPNLQESHAVDRLWRVAEAFGVGDQPKRFPIAVQPIANEWVESQLQKCARPWIVVAAGARWLTKRWPPEHFAELVNRAQSKFGGTAIVVGTRDEQDIGLQLSAKVAGPVKDFSGLTSLSQLIAILSKADVMLANDTGPLHVATALGRPVVSPYTCTSVRLHGPYGVERGPVESAIWCQGSYRKKCDRMECMSELQPDRLWYFLHEVLAKWSRSSRSA